MKKMCLIYLVFFGVFLGINNSLAQTRADGVGAFRGGRALLHSSSWEYVGESQGVSLNVKFEAKYNSYDIKVDGKNFCSVWMPSITNKKTVPTGCTNGNYYITADMRKNLIGQTKYCFEIFETGKNVVLDRVDDMFFFKGNGYKWTFNSGKI